jgi:hypothetical protein
MALGASACNAGTGAAATANAQEKSTEASEAERVAEAARAEKDAKRDKLRSDVAAAESERSALASRLETATKSAGMYELQSENYQQAIEQQEITTKAFMMDHKAATIAIAAGIGGLKDLQDEQLSTDEHGFDGIAVTLAIAYGLGHMDEIKQVIDALVQADSHIKDLRAASERANQERQGAEEQMRDLQANIAGLDQKLGELRASLAAL